MANIDDIKTILNINDSSNDNLLNLYIRKSLILIATYLNIPTVSVTTTDPWIGITMTTQPIDVSATYPDAVVEYCVECYRKKGNETVKQFSEGNRSATYKDELSDSVKALLPVPYIGMLSTRRYPYDY